jgi:hypothetical protein
VVSTRPLVEPTTTKREAGALAPNYKALFAREPCEFLVSLEVTTPGSAKEISYLLTTKILRREIKKMKKYLKRKSKNSDTIRKESVTSL